MKGIPVGFIGLGSQGAPMAHRILEAGFPLTVWGRRAETVAPFDGTVATVVGSAAEVGAASEIVCICVVTDADVEDVLTGDEGVLAGMPAGGIVAVHSTIHPATVGRLAEDAAARGIAVVDAPVSGGAPAIAEGRLLVMVGGARGAVDRCRDVFETFGDPVIHLGGLGSGQVAKAINNLVFTVQVGLALETYAFADALGVDRAALAEVLANGSGGSRAAAILAASGFDPTGIRGAAPLLRKDVDIALDVARAAKAPPPGLLADLANTALAMLGEARSNHAPG